MNREERRNHIHEYKRVIDSHPSIFTCVHCGQKQPVPKYIEATK